MAFLQFELSERNKKAIIKIINRYYNLNGVNMTFVNQPGIISKFDIRVPKNLGEQFFKDMLIQLSNGLDMGIDTLTSDMQSTMVAMTKHKVPNDYLEVQYSVNDYKKELFVATTNLNYSESYWNKVGAKPWVENSIGISGTPESIEPIIRDISKKLLLNIAIMLKYKDGIIISKLLIHQIQLYRKKLMKKKLYQLLLMFMQPIRMIMLEIIL